TKERPKALEIHQLPLQKQPHALTQAALIPLSGGAFHPGVELTWVFEQPELFSDEEPFRIAVGDRTELSQNMGRLITPENTIPPKNWSKDSPYYPIGPQSPGDLTRWMGLPWQPDAFSCQSINYANDFPTLVWWPALLPVEVFPEFAFRQLSNTSLSEVERLVFANTRVAWSRGGAGIGYHANGSYFDGLNRMVYAWEQMGFVLKQKTPKEFVSLLGEFVFVEMERGTMDLEFFQKPNLGRKG
ncbi:MAG: LodA/GoxA family CTQ-dependent oxidase, partial [Flavobacteriales bacterium]|nr:LodA/GoxA family CTQ-dependent oxidase [Flavobacteriales bacterium]